VAWQGEGGRGDGASANAVASPSSAGGVREAKLGVRDTQRLLRDKIAELERQVGEDGSHTGDPLSVI
jgi:hypothetical protein